VSTETVYLPPEVCGCLSVAQRHLDAMKHKSRRRWRDKQQQAKHLSKVQKLVDKAARILQGDAK